jgi:hypothetical protein
MIAHRSSTGRFTMRAIIRAALVLACTSSVAQAQLGGLLKKAIEKKVENKVENKIEDKVAPEGAAPPLAGDPVTAGVLEQVLKGLAVEVSSGQAYEAKHAELLKKQDAWRAADEAARPDVEANSKAKSKFENCMDPLLRKAKDAADQAAQDKLLHLANDPKNQEFLKQFAALSQKVAEAQQKKDYEAVKRLTRDVEKLMGIDPAADSAAAYKTCGRPPSPTAAMVHAEALRKEADDLQEEARKLEQGRAAQAAAAAGLSADLYATARERLLTWNVQKKYKQRLSVTKDEDALFSSRLVDIKKVESALR